MPHPGTPPAEVVQTLVRKFMLGQDRIPGLLDPSRIPPMPDLHLRKETLQCQNCFKPSTKTALFRCKGCKVDVYCSKECQRSAWRSHKPMCLEFVNRSSDASNGPGGQEADEDIIMRRLRKFTRQHHRLLIEIAIQALELWSDPSRSHDFIVVIYLRSRKGSTKPEKYFYATEAEVVPIGALNVGPLERDRMLREHVKAETERAKQFGMVGSLLVVLMAWDVKEEKITFLKVPGGFGANRLRSYGQPWKQLLFTFLNNGVLL